MEKIKQELHEVYLKYKDFDFMNYYYKISKSNTNNKYSKGEGFVAGLYEPSYVDEMRCGNATIGKEITKIDKGYDYKYYFDKNDRIILSERYLEGKLSYINFYFHKDNVLEFIHYQVNRGIYSLSKSFYLENGRICRHIQLPMFFKYDPVDSFIYEEQLFEYEDDVTHITLISRYSEVGKSDRVKKMKIIENMLYYLDDNFNVVSFYPIRFKLVDGKKVSVPLPKRVPIFKIIKENIVKILNKWQNVDKSVIWINCESSDLEMQYTSLSDDCEEKWNIAFYDANEEKIFDDPTCPQVLEDLLFNNGCDIDDLIGGSEYFVVKMIKIIKDLRKEGYLSDDTAVILSDLEISCEALDIAKKINPKETIKGLLEEFAFCIQ